VVNPYEGLAIKPDGTPFHLAKSSHFSGCEWCSVNDALFKSLVERAGGKYTQHVAEFDVQKQLGFLDDCVSVLKPDMVVVHPCDEAAAAPGVERLEAAGISAYIYDFRIGTEQYTSNIYHDFDGQFGANLLGQALVDIAERENKEIFLLEVWGNRGEVSAFDRAEGLHAAIDQCPLITTMESADTMWGDAENAAAVIDNFTARPELNAFWYMDGGAEGCIEGLRSIGRLHPIGHPDHVIASNLTPSSGVIEAMLNKEFDCVSNHQPWDLADITIKIAFTHVILGQPVPKDVVVPMGVMTADNILSEQLFGVPMGYALMPMGEWDIWPIMDTVIDPVYDQAPDGTLTTYPLPAPTVAMRMELQGY